MIQERFPESVFPAYAGMSPRPSWTCAWASGFPRLRGDEPGDAGDREGHGQFSPPTRG